MASFQLGSLLLESDDSVLHAGLLRSSLTDHLDSSSQFMFIPASSFLPGPLWMEASCFDRGPPDQLLGNPAAFRHSRIRPPTFSELPASSQKASLGLISLATFPLSPSPSLFARPSLLPSSRSATFPLSFPLSFSLPGQANLSSMYNGYGNMSVFQLVSPVLGLLFYNAISLHSPPSLSLSAWTSAHLPSLFLSGTQAEHPLNCHLSSLPFLLSFSLPSLPGRASPSTSYHLSSLPFPLSLSARPSKLLKLPAPSQCPSRPHPGSPSAGPGQDPISLERPTSPRLCSHLQLKPDPS